ncbi:hypothetical protein OROMI_015523 [Orobanche minor]
MLDINLIREEKGGKPEIIRESQRRRFKPVEIVDEVIRLDKEWRKDQLRKELNRLQREIGQLMAAKEDATDKIKSKEEIEKSIKVKDIQVQEVQKLVHEKIGIYWKPCARFSSHKTRRDNVVVRECGEKRLEPKLKNHVDLGELLGIVDSKTGGKVAGNRGYFLLGAGVRLNQALIGFGLDFLEKRGYTEMQPPSCNHPIFLR